MSYATLVDIASVLVVDDHRVFAELLTMRLRRDAAVEHAQVACTVEQARAAVDQRAPDVVLLDPELEGGSGLELIPHLRLLENRPLVVVLADVAHTSLEVLGLDTDECTLVSKESPFEDLVHAIRAVRRGRLLHPPLGHGPAAPAVRVPQDGRLDDGPRGDLEPGPAPTLTARQADVLRCLLAGMTRAQVASGLGLSPHTVRDHVRHLFRIAGVTSTPDLVSWAGPGEVTPPRRPRRLEGGSQPVGSAP